MIRLVTISRISREKGFNRMLKLEQILNDSGVDFIWDCYGDLNTNHAREIVKKFKYVRFNGITNEPLEVMKNYDYLVQLSDTEGFPYSIYEAMQRCVPVIATDFPSIHEMIENGVNGYIIKKDLTNFDVTKIITNIPVVDEFKEKSTEKDWIKFLNMAGRKKIVKPQPTEKPLGRADQDSRHYERDTDIVTVRATRQYHDTVLDKLIPQGKSHKVTRARAKVLEAANVAKIV